MKKDELQNFDGKEGNKAYVSNMGKVYDVTDSRMWKNGKHANKHFAGMDLTEALKSAPHGPEVLERFAHVGDIETLAAAKQATADKGAKEIIRKLYRIIHPHPMFIHFPMGLLNFVMIMQIIYLATGMESFETASFYGLCTALFFMVPTIVSGFVSWWVNYDMSNGVIFKNKIIFSIILFILCVAEVAMRFSNPDMATQSTGLGTLYNIMIFVNVPVLAVIGYNGGKLSWG